MTFPGSHRFVAVACALMLLTGGVSAQQGYPNKPIRMIVPFGAGGSTDNLARTMGRS